MPIYEYRCQNCGEINEAYRSVANRDDALQCKCGGPTKKIISNYRVIGDAPYYDDTLQTEIRSKKHRRQVMKEQGVSEVYGKGWT